METFFFHLVKEVLVCLSVVSRFVYCSGVSGLVVGWALFHWDLFLAPSTSRRAKGRVVWYTLESEPSLVSEMHGKKVQGEVEGMLPLHGNLINDLAIGLHSGLDNVKTCSLICEVLSCFKSIPTVTASFGVGFNARLRVCHGHG